VTAASVTLGAGAAFFASGLLSLLLARSKSSFWPRDVPNARSLHAQSTPRTGGLAILLGVGSAFAITGATADASFAWIGAATVGLALLSFADDRRGLPVSVRLAGQALAAAGLGWGAGLVAPRVWLPLAGSVSLGSFDAPLTFLGVLWMTNLYNFMDGMDGLAGSMTVIGGAFLGVACWRGGDAAGAAVSFFLSAAAAGFLIQNRPPARIFLGDVGAIPIGFLVAAVALRGSAAGLVDLGASCLVFAPFIVDATATLVRRALAGERVWTPHRSHHYQRLVLSGFSHARVLSWEIALMGVSGAAALAYATGAGSVRVTILATLVLLYAIAGAAVKRVERDRR
jgi:UDP-N-acetylmuramyl pentapeptide phosphotransferase/UDP-N-acetylglucosamine-1-phosphate transferase